MPIPKQDKRKPEPLKVNLHPDVLARLDKYSEQQESDKDYIVEQILKAFFEEEDRLAAKTTANSTLPKRGKKPQLVKEAVA